MLHLSGEKGKDVREAGGPHTALLTQQRRRRSQLLPGVAYKYGAVITQCSLKTRDECSGVPHTKSRYVASHLV